MRRLCEVFRSPRRSETYLYVDKSAGYKDLPEALLEQFGESSSSSTIRPGTACSRPCRCSPS